MCDIHAKLPRGQAQDLGRHGHCGCGASTRVGGFDFAAGFLFGKAQLVELLQIQPELRAGAEEVGQA